jgi:hypothetical protein
MYIFYVTYIIFNQRVDMVGENEDEIYKIKRLFRYE